MVVSPMASMLKNLKKNKGRNNILQSDNPNNQHLFKSNCSYISQAVQNQSIFPFFFISCVGRLDLSVKDSVCVVAQQQYQERNRY